MDYRIAVPDDLWNPLCRECPLGIKTEVTNRCVPGRALGTGPVRIVMVGEAPGYHEDRQNMTFVGESGQLLIQMIAAAGLTRTTYVTNICKCRPPQNRSPKPLEMDTCTNLYLKRELEVLNPRLIVALGLVAQSMFEMESGRAFIKRAKLYGRTWNVVRCPHPAYALRMADSNKLKEILQKVALELNKE